MNASSSPNAVQAVAPQPPSGQQPVAGSSSSSGLDLEAAARRVVALEGQAQEAHLLAQRLNKEGRFAEAQEAYALMHRLEDEASVLARSVGCVACVLGGPGQGQQDCAALEYPADIEQYGVLHAMPSWAVADARCKQLGAPAMPTAPQAAGASGGAEAVGSSTNGPSAQGQGPAVQLRAAGAVLGSTVADAAATGVHWVYDLDALQQLAAEVAGKGLPGLEFLDPPRSPFYNYAVGRSSPYGEQTLVLLHSLASCWGLDCLGYASLLEERFGGGSGFDGYRDVSLKGFLRNSERGLLPPLSGADDAQANCVARLAPLVAAFAGHPDLLRLVSYATRTTQNTVAAVAWGCCGAAVLEKIVCGLPPSQAVHMTMQELRGETQEGSGGSSQLAQLCGPMCAELAGHLGRVAQLAATPPSEAVAALGGRNCHMPNALLTPLQVALHVEHLMQAGAQQQGPGASHAAMDPQRWYTLGVRLAIREGGCCASRASYVGACLGAMLGAAGSPVAVGGTHVGSAPSAGGGVGAAGASTVGRGPRAGLVPHFIPDHWAQRCIAFQGVAEDVAAVCAARGSA